MHFGILCQIIELSILTLCLLVFTVRRYASAVYAMALCLSVFVSVTSRCSTKMARNRIMQTIPHLILLNSQWSARHRAWYILTGVAGVARPGPLLQSCQARTPRHVKPVTPLNIKLSVGRWRLLHIDGKQMSLLAAVSAPHAPLGEGRPSSLGRH